MMSAHNTVRRPHPRAGDPTERRRFDALRDTIETLWTMNIPESKLKLVYRVDQGKLMAFGLSMKMTADLGSISYGAMKYMNPAALEKAIEAVLGTKKLKFTTYELDMKKFLQMKKSRAQHANIFADCNSELFPHHRKGITVEMYALKHGMTENEAEKLLDDAEKELLIKVD
jgi:hypothetical protein